MLRSLAAVMVLGCASMALGQTVYAPAQEGSFYNPFNPKMDQHHAKLLWVLSQHWTVPAPGMREGLTPGQDIAGEGATVIRMRDISPNKEKRMMEERERQQMMNEKPAAPEGEHAGEISIRPYRAHGRETSVDTSQNPANPAKKGEVIIRPYHK